MNTLKKSDNHTQMFNTNNRIFKKPKSKQGLSQLPKLKNEEQDFIYEFK